MLHELPPISVILPVFNSEKSLWKAITSILRQTYSNFELVIVDDGSEDGSRSIISSFTDPRISVYFRQHEGLGATLNYGLLKAKYEIIARMDADDISLPGRLEQQLKYFIKRPDNTVLSCWYALFKNKQIIGCVYGNTDHDKIYARLALHNELTHSGIMCRKSTILRAGGYKNEHFEDFELWLRLKDNVHFANYPAVLSFVQINNDSFSRAGQSTKDKMVYDLLYKHAATPEELQEKFKISSFTKAVEILGWREYFYGIPKNARNFWKVILLRSDTSFKVYPAYLLTFLHLDLLRYFRNLFPRFRLHRLVNYFSREQRALTRSFKILESEAQI